MKKALIIVRNVELEVQYDSFEDESVTITGLYAGQQDIIELVENDEDIMEEVLDEIAKLEIVSDEDEY